MLSFICFLHNQMLSMLAKLSWQKSSRIASGAAGLLELIVPWTTGHHQSPNQLQLNGRGMHRCRRCNLTLNWPALWCLPTCYFFVSFITSLVARLERYSSTDISAISCLFHHSQSSSMSVSMFMLMFVSVCVFVHCHHQDLHFGFHVHLHPSLSTSRN